MVLLAVIASYILGSIPTGYILVKAIKGIDVRSHGSGNFGATNVFRVVNPALGILVLILDILKGLVAATFIADWALGSSISIDPIILRLLLAAAAVSGHNWTIFLQFKGGKGIATTAGALLGLSIKIPQLGLLFGLCFGIWLLILLSTGIVSLASILASISLPIFMLIFHQPFKLQIFTIALCLFALYRHKSNIRRLLRGEEKTIFERS
ncbi:glycerol-3-phosphate 1-O-acyltransferase PlsY [Candidatus Omnitrophota bacterium]